MSAKFAAFENKSLFVLKARHSSANEDMLPFFLVGEIYSTDGRGTCAGLRDSRSSQSDWDGILVKGGLDRRSR